MKAAGASPPELRADFNYFSVENGFFKIFAGQAIFSSFNNGMVRETENCSSLPKQSANSDKVHVF